MEPFRTVLVVCLGLVLFAGSASTQPSIPVDTSLEDVARMQASVARGTVYTSFEVDDNWGTAFQGHISITNYANWIIWDWVLEFDFPHSIDVIWDAEIIEHVGDHYKIAAVQQPWEDGDIAPGERVEFGFIASPGGTVRDPANGTLNGAYVSFHGSTPAPPPLELPDPPLWPMRCFAPYVDVCNWPPFDLVGAARDEGILFQNLAFIVAASPSNGTPSWGGYYTVGSGYMLPEIYAIRSLGGDVMISLGGAAGTVLAAAHDTVASLQDAYQTIIDTYKLSHIDFDIEGAWVADPVTVERRSRAIAALQVDMAAAGRDLYVWYTLPVLPDGLTLDGLNVVQSALNHGVELAGVNIMAMDYGDQAAPNPQGRMGDYAIQAATNLFHQLKILYFNAGIPKTDEELWQMTGITPMIGLNDVITEIFDQPEAVEVFDFACQQNIGLLSFWSLNRDRECPGGPCPNVCPNCSSVPQTPFEFSQIFLPFVR